MYKYLQTLNEGQYKAATTIQGPVRILAGAGSGKTHTLISRVAYMIDCGIPPEQILLLTFTNNAAQNMVTRAAAMADSRCSKITACTYHSFCTRLLRHYGMAIGIEPGFSILTPAEAADAVKLVKSATPYYDDLEKFPAPKKIVDIYSKSQNMMLSLDRTIQLFYKDAAPLTGHIQTLIESYKAYKEEKNLMDYDDLLVYTLKLLGKDSIRNKISDSYRYIMVDEYQDTNALQEKILFLIAKKYQNLAIVGDDYQSIYAFRGSDINNILCFPERFSDKCNTILININYRSTEEILAVANHMMDTYASFGCKKTMYANNKHGEKPYLFQPANCDDETKYVINHIENLRSKKEDLKNIAILERNSMSSFQIENELNRRCIPYRKLGGLKFMEYTCVLDMLALMRAYTNPKDELAFYRILDLLPRIGSAYANKVVSDLMRLGINTDSIYAYKKLAFYPHLSRMVTTLVNTAWEMDIASQFEHLYSFYVDIRQFKIDHMRTKNADKKADEIDKLKSDLQALSALRDMVLEYDNILAFLDDIVLDASKVPEDENILTISTIHSAKGMEWDHVFMIQCTDGVFPKINKYEHDETNDKEYLEELRCFYVAVTRAKTNLHIIAPYSVNVCGRSISGDVAHYLDHSLKDMQKGMIPEVKEEALAFTFTPSSVKDKDLDSILSYAEMQDLSDSVCNRSTCSICGCHAAALYPQSFWSYDDKKMERSLKKIAAVCEDCQKVLHADALQSASEIDDAILHYMRTNECTKEKAMEQYEEAKDSFAMRDKYNWSQKINMGLVKKIMATPYKEERAKIYLIVPFEDKDMVKSLGARWDQAERSWYIPSNCKTPLDQFAPWM